VRCPSGGDCFAVDCQLRGCQGYDVHIEAITVVHTTIRRRAVVGLVFGAQDPRKPALPEPVEG
jgi:hypothetical protein